jgi:hypothetical protein
MGACALLAVLAAGVTGCSEPPAAAGERLARVKQEAAELHRVLDDVEERLLGNQSQVQMWQELGRRHQAVSALACENVNSHVVEMAKNLDLQQDRTRRLRRGRPEVRAQAVSAAPVKARSSGSN